MTAERLTTSRLFITSVVEGRSDLDEKFDKAYNNVMSLTHNLTEKEAHDVLNKHIDENKQHEEVCLGLMVGILCDPPMGKRLFQDLMLVCRDSLKSVCDALCQSIVGERFHKLLETAKKQVVWLVRQLVQSGVSQVETVVWGLLRQMAGGDVSPSNLWLAESLCDLLRDNKSWLDRLGVMIASTVYSFLRVLEDHQPPHFAALRQKELALVIPLLREKFQECLVIGRDLIRLLQNVAKIPEIEAFWRDLLHNPGSLAPNFQGLVQLLSTRTSRRFFVVRLTPDMEKMIVFLCSEVKFGMQKRYQDWFQRQFLSTPESQTLRCDLIRFIIGCIHPTNEVLCSDIIPRWAVIGWLISSSTSPIATANCKLALFYDWLFFSGESDNIMNIEPGILVMSNSMKPAYPLTTALLDFLCRIITQFQPTLTIQVRAGITSSLRQIMEKKVLPHLESLFDHARMDPELRRLVRETFPEFCSAAGDHSGAGSSGSGPHCSGASSSGGSSLGKLDLMVETGLDFSSSVAPSIGAAGSDLDNNISNHHDEDAMFSDEEDDTCISVSSGGSSSNITQSNRLIASSSKSNSRCRTEPVVNAPNYSYPSATTTVVTISNTASSTTTSTQQHISLSSILHTNNVTSKPLTNLSSSITYGGASAASKTNSNNNNNNSGKSSSNCISSSSDDIIELDTRNSNSNDGVSVINGDSLVNGGRTSSGGISVNSNNSVSLAMSPQETLQFNTHLESLEPDMKDFLLDYKLEKDQNRRCEVLQKICDLVISDDLDIDEAEHLGGALAILLCPVYASDTPQLPERITQESLCESLESPVFVVFENLVGVGEDDNTNRGMLLLVNALQHQLPSTGYRLLYYLKALHKTTKNNSSLSLQVYRELWKASGQKDFNGFIVRDISACSEDDPRLLCWLLPHIYSSFPKYTVGNAELVRLVLQRLDAAQLHDLVCLVLQGALVMFDNGSFINILDKSLSWESVEQFFLWQLARAHEIPVDCCVSVLHRLHFTSHAHCVTSVHAEALANILMMLRRESPSEPLLRHVLQRELRPQDPTVATILQYWVQRYEDKMAMLIGEIVNTKPPSSPNKRKRNQGGGGGGKNNAALSSYVTIDQLLSHLNHLRTACDQTKFFSLASMQESLQNALGQCSESQKKTYKDLFALVVSNSEEKKEETSNASSSSGGTAAVTRNKQQQQQQQPPNNKRGRKPKVRKKQESESEEELLLSSEEEDVKKPSRKRKKNTFTSDSD